MYSWQKHFHFGVVHPAHFPQARTPEGYVATLKQVLADPMFQAVEIGPVQDVQRRAKIRSMVDSAGVEVVFLGGGTLKVNNLSLSDLDEGGRTAAVEKLKTLVDQAYSLGAKSMLVMSGGDPGAEGRERAMQQLVKSVKQAAQYAIDTAHNCVNGQPLVFVFETFDREATIRQLLGPTSEAAAFVREVRRDYPNVGLTMDQSHFPQMGESPVEAVRTAGDAALHAHLANCFVKDPADPLYGDRHLRFCMPRTEIDTAAMTRYLQALLDTGFTRRPGPHGKPVISVEVKPWEGEDPDIVLAGAQRTFLRACEDVRWPD